MHPLWAVLPGAVLGVALQLLQARLWPVAGYAGLLAAALLLAGVAARVGARRRAGLALGAALLAGALAAAGATAVPSRDHPRRLFHVTLPSNDPAPCG